MLIIEYRCPVDGWPLYYDSGARAYRCGACPRNWGPGEGVDKDNCRVVLGRGTGLRDEAGFIWLRGRIDLYYDRGRLKAVSEQHGRRWRPA